VQRRPSGCAFHPRCAYAVDQCGTDDPPLVLHGDRRLACHVDPFAK
jgi:ABC-type dipeptide/oligopeptide/nickel transport system ATPase component